MIERCKPMYIQLWATVLLLGCWMLPAGALDPSAAPSVGSGPYRMWLPYRVFPGREILVDDLQGHYRPPPVECAYYLPTLTFPCISVLGSRTSTPYLIGLHGVVERHIRPARTQRGMPDAPQDGSGKGYFQALCAAEAGERIQGQVVPDQALLELRPRLPVDAHLRHQDQGRLSVAQVLQRDPYLLEDPLGDVNAEYTPALARQALEHLRLPAFESVDYGRPPPIEAPLSYWWQHQSELRTDYPDGVPLEGLPAHPVGPVRLKVYRPPNEARSPLPEPVTARYAVSRYGFYWRGLRHAYDREHRVAGRELGLVDLITGQLVATQRAFVQWDPHGDPGAVCPATAAGPNALMEFIARVLATAPRAPDPATTTLPWIHRDSQLPEGLRSKLLRSE